VTQRPARSLLRKLLRLRHPNGDGEKRAWTGGFVILPRHRRTRIAHDADLLDGDLKRRRPITDADVTDAVDWIERIALAIAMVLG
jgi:hypothetical protein